MNTIVSGYNEKSLLIACDLIKKGDIISFPTETIYGLFANALNESAIEKIFEAKNRPSDNPLIVHVADQADINQYAVISNDIEQLLIDKFMPGPFTLVLRKKSLVSYTVTGGLDTVCVRIPDHSIAREIIAGSGVALVGPSANIAGRPSPTNAYMVLDDMNGRIPLIIDGGETLYGIESTVVKVEDSGGGHYTIKILRPGFITKEDIECDLPPHVNVLYETHDLKQSPGTKYRHYSPYAPVSIFSDLSTMSIFDTNKHIAIIATEEFYRLYKDELFLLQQRLSIEYITLGSIDNLIQCAHNLYYSYSLCDKYDVDSIFVQSLPEYGIGYALMNRIRKSAGLI